jgi:hypothetical protein
MRAGILFYYTREVEKPTPLSETDYYLLKDLYLNATWSYEQYNEIFEEKTEQFKTEDGYLVMKASPTVFRDNETVKEVMESKKESLPGFVTYGTELSIIPLLDQNIAKKLKEFK